MRGWQYSLQYSLPTSRLQALQGGQGLGFQGYQGGQGPPQGWQQGFQGGHGFGFQDFQGRQGFGNGSYKQGLGRGRLGGRGGGRCGCVIFGQVMNECVTSVRRQRIEKFTETLFTREALYSAPDGGRRAAQRRPRPRRLHSLNRNMKRPTAKRTMLHCGRRRRGWPGGRAREARRPPSGRGRASASSTGT